MDVSYNGSLSRSVNVIGSDDIQDGNETLDVFLPVQQAEKAPRDDSVQSFLKVRNIQCLVGDQFVGVIG